MRRTYRALSPPWALSCSASSAPPYIAMESYAALRPDRAAARLSALSAWLDFRRDSVVVIVSLALGLRLVGDGIYLLAG
jgi:hypothetical protein